MSHTTIDLTRMSRRSFVGASASLLAALGLAGTRAFAADSQGQDGKAASSTSSDASAAFPVTIKHAFGEITIETMPERIATIGWGNQDAVLALGIAPVGFEAANYGIVEGETMFPWTQEALEALGATDTVTFDNTDGYDYEAVSDTNPDIILAPYSGMTQDDYDKLSKIAPVLAYPELAWSTMWRDVVKNEAAALGMPEKGEEVIATAEQAIADAVAKHPEIEGKNALFTYFTATDLSSFYAYLRADPRADYLPDLGLGYPESIESLAVDANTFSISVSAENADQLSDIDVIITYGDEALLQQLQDDALLGVIPAIKNGAVVLLDGTTHIAGASTPTCLSIPATVDEYVGMIAEAVAKIEA